MARLIIQRGGSDETIAIPPEKSAFVIGRAPGCDLVIDDTASSRRHCQVECDGSGHKLVDLKSSNGTRLNGAKVDSAPLKDGDAIQIGNAVIRFHADAADVSEIVLDEPAGGATFLLKLRGGDRDGETVALTPGKHAVGRSPKNSIVIVTTGVSGVHAEIRVEGLQASLKDLGSTNGTFVNGAKITDSPLSHGDTIRFGGQSALFVDSARAAVEEASPSTSDDAAPLVDSVRDVDVPRRRGGGLLVALALLVVLGGGAAAYVYLPTLFPGVAGEKAARAAVRSADNRVPEGAWSFEGESAANSWRVRGTGAPAGPRIGETDAASGLACLSLSLPDSGVEPLAVELAEAIPISTARTYRLTARARGAGAAGGAGILLAWTGAGADGTVTEIALDASDVKAVDRGEWTEISVVATPPRSASSVRPALFVAGGGAAFLFDDVVLTEGSDGATASLAAGDAEFRLGPKGDVSAARGVRALFHDLVPVATVAPRATEEGAGEPAALSTLFFGSVEASRVEAGRAEWTIAFLELTAVADAGAAEPLAVKETIDTRPNGFGVLLEWPRGARAVASSGIELRIDASQEPVFTIVGEGGAEAVEGELSRAGVRDVIVGRVTAVAGQGEPFRLRFDPPAAVRVARGEDGALRLAASAGAGERLETTVQTTFVEERNTALAHRDAMKKAEDGRRWGEALAKAEEVLKDLPFHDGAVADATSAVARLRDKGESDAKGLEERRLDVEFLPTRATLAALLADARTAADAWTGTRYSERAAAVADACRERLATMERSASTSEAARLEERAADLEASGHAELARKLRSAAGRLGAAREPASGAGGADAEKSSGGGGR